MYAIHTCCVFMDVYFVLFPLLFASLCMRMTWSSRPIARVLFINKIKRRQFLFRMRACHACCVFMYVCFLLSFFCLYIRVCVCLQIQGPLRECRSILSSASGLPYYCAPLVCVPAVIGLLAVWRYNKPKPQPEFSPKKVVSVYFSPDPYTAPGLSSDAIKTTACSWHLLCFTTYTL